MSSSRETDQTGPNERDSSALDRVASLVRKSIMLGGLALGAAYSVSSHTGNLISRTYDALERNEAGEDDKI